jgi:sugar phosphate isomerase/epimerase
LRQVGVCSWSLRPSSPRELARDLLACGTSHIQLALDPIRTGAWSEAELCAILLEDRLQVLSGMMTTIGEDYTTLDSIRTTGGLRPAEHWPANLAAAHQNAALAARLGIRLVTLHAGFLPHDPADSLRATMISRLHEVVRAFAAKGVLVGLETGQEDADTLLGILHELRDDRPGVNFDPANIILYGMGDPVAALRKLAPHIVQVHIKDALPAKHAGEWGTEVVAGTGAVDWPAFFEAASSLPPDVHFIIEREAGEARVADIKTARALITRLGGI